MPVVSNVNLPAGTVRPNLVTVKVGRNGRVSIYNNSGSMHVVADAVGYFTNGNGARYVPLLPRRVLDSRVGTGGFAMPWGPAVTRHLTVVGGATGVPTDATAVVINVTATAPSAASHVTIWPTGRAMPVASNLNFTMGQTVANLAVVAIGNGGRISIYNNSGTTHVVADIVGYYHPTMGSLFTPVSPRRLLDSRGVSEYYKPWGPGETREVAVAGDGTGAPANATAVVLNATGVAPSAATHLTLWPAGQPMPLASNLNLPPGDTRANLAITKVGIAGNVAFYNNSGTTNIVADVVGYYSD